MKLRRLPRRMSAHSSRRAGRCRGFTLVEILTATAIMSLIVSLVMTILTQVMSAWDRSSDDLQMSGDASEVFQLVTQDLETAIFRNDGNQWLSLTTETPAGSPVSTASMSRLIFYTSSQLRQTKDNGTSGAAGNPIPGDISLVEYRVTFSDPFGNQDSTQKEFQLHRVIVDPASTFEGVNSKPLMGIGFGSGSAITSLAQAFDTLIDSSSVPVKSQVPTTQGKSLNISVYGANTPASMLKENVAQFNVYLYFYGQDIANAAAAQTPAIQPYPMGVYRTISPAAYYYGGAQQANGASVPNSPGYLDTYTSGKPTPTFIAMAYADLSITFLTGDGVALLQSFGGSMPEGFNWPQFVQQYGKTYTQRVRFYNKPR